MARPRRISDTIVHDAVLTLIRTKGEKAVTFSAVAERSGLAASSLAERHGSVAGMIADARAGLWSRLEAATDQAILGASMDAKGALALLKALAPVEGPVVGSDPERAARWRARIESDLALRLGGGASGREAAAILFACWQGQILWRGAGDLRLKAVLKRLKG